MLKAVLLLLATVILTAFIIIVPISVLVKAPLKQKTAQRKPVAPRVRVPRKAFKRKTTAITQNHWDEIMSANIKGVAANDQFLPQQERSPRFRDWRFNY